MARAKSKKTPAKKSGALDAIKRKAPKAAGPVKSNREGKKREKAVAAHPESAAMAAHYAKHGKGSKVKFAHGGKMWTVHKTKSAYRLKRTATVRDKVTGEKKPKNFSKSFLTNKTSGKTVLRTRAK